ncbi:Hypothetical_protein [Hexamita inflata]|uniref:Hypothetical_protein n=1 Tax=Hexamita inflata TaxID=28002 RepID=A0AA86NFU1_9EUKA|nr:Hypothetical protein HINF_LOCUS6131 [Hexamita inflata]
MLQNIQNQNDPSLSVQNTLRVIYLKHKCQELSQHQSAVYSRKKFAKNYLTGFKQCKQFQLIFSSTTCLRQQLQLYPAPEMHNNSKYGLHQFRKINTLNTLSRTSRLSLEQEFVPLQQRIKDNVFSQASTSGIFDLSFESKENLRFIEEINLFLQ